MDARVILSKIVTLIYRTRLLGSCENDDLIRTILQTVNVETPEFKLGTASVLKKLQELCLDMLGDKDIIPKEVLLPRLQLSLEIDVKLYTSLKESIESEYSEATNKRVITSLVKSLHYYYKEAQAIDLLNKANYEIKFARSKIPNLSEYMNNLFAKMEPFMTNTDGLKDPALVNEMDFENQDSVSEVFSQVVANSSNASVYKTGSQDFNDMAQGGIRRGETTTIGALQHKYKTGFTLSMFADIAMYNSPVITKTEVGKKPLLLRISFEDNLTNNLQFLYQYFKAIDGEPVDPKKICELPVKELSAYVTERMTKTGFHVKMMRIDPTQWSYSNLFNKVVELEAQGYAVHVLMVDYLGMLPTTGCTQGAMGADKRDLLRRVRNFTSARNIAFITPLQLSTEAKKMIRVGVVTEDQFVNEVAEKGMYADCSQYDQEIDLEVYIHLFKHKRKTYLAVRRGKHRLPTVVDEEQKYYIMAFPGLNIPIMPDLDKEPTGIRKLPKVFVQGSDAAELATEVFG